MSNRRPDIPKLFRTPFSVEASAPFRRHLNRLEVEIGREDYRHLKTVELLSSPPAEADFSRMEEITSRVTATTQNDYNRDLLQRLGIRVYLDGQRYAVYYRLPDRVVRFTAAWRERVLRFFFAAATTADTGWRPPPPALPGISARYLPDDAGGVLLLRRGESTSADLPLLTATHCPYDPHTLEVAFWLLAADCGRAAVINLGFSGREPLTDGNLEKLKSWGIPLNPSNIDVIYPYADAGGHSYCYKLEENFRRYVEIIGGDPPSLVIDIHGCVGTGFRDRRIIVGLGGSPPFPEAAELGTLTEVDGLFRLEPAAALQQGLSFLEHLGGDLHLQFRSEPHRGYHFCRQGSLYTGRGLDPGREVASLLPGEERNWLPELAIRWLPGAGGNALQRREVRRLHPEALCLHVEIPGRIRREIARSWRQRETSLASTGGFAG